jgi:transcriptional regulator with XRE-family HTH domain
MQNNKIKNLLVIKDMSPSKFADEIGVQRAIISHILSGRNRPSLEVVQKIIRRFPELGTDWIIEEDESTEEGESNEKSRQVQTPSLTASKIEPFKELSSKESQPTQEASTDRKIEKILIFYSDKTFSEYRPG